MFRKTHAGRAVYADIAYTSAFREFVMQILGGIYLGRTGNVGRQREFYLIHHLRPYAHGKAAYRMYLGALFWLIGCAVIIPFWLGVVIFMIISIRIRDRHIRWLDRIRKRDKPASSQPRHSRIRRWINKHILHAKVSDWIDHTEDTILRANSNFREKLRRGLDRYVVQTRVTRWLSSYILHGRFTPWELVLQWRKRRQEENARRLRWRDPDEEPEGDGKMEELKQPIMTLMLLIGTASFVAQWIFWDGFVKAILSTQTWDIDRDMGLWVNIR
ncbi:hypothetical protein FGG08_001107 [Glutinoglossum americanum]|uniref:Uncharacterized protein n=1 Tax=Glutinoglossum americanum TaxID=1670608 RepID=A0A9P8L5J2_9PEZI|nr:hypothetical protein FGG08_001107 [Glutinoglossum americanum]